MKRIDFIKSTIAGSILVPSLIYPLLKGDPEPLDKNLVENFVRTAHSNKEEVVAMLKAHPSLLNAAYDWGGGDFETGLGAASHVGNKEIALYLVGLGAQTNIFTACLFGQLAIVKQILEIFPSTLNAKGPHGFTPLHHAIKGGEGALPVRAYLEELGASQTKLPIY